MNLRPAIAEDAPAIAVLLRTTFRVSLLFLPELHSAEEDLNFVARRMLPSSTVWVAEDGAALAGFIAYRADWIDHLYVAPGRQGQGLGPMLLEKALESGEPRQLWTFQQNDQARRFYESRGFEAVEFTDGAGNEEKTPDVRYLWRGQGL